MSATDIAQLELLAQVDDVVDRLKQWSTADSPWEPMRRVQALVKRLLSRVDTLRIRLEAPLIVATFGGTGTGKSTLVNGLVGQNCTTTGKERPTTRRPVLLVHPQTPVEQLGLTLEDFVVVSVESPILRDIILIDCPDTDTTEEETLGSNLDRLHRLLPHCDVLIYASTQQKYRSARVTEELADAATGCRLLFVQTRGDLDEDIRDDWRTQLETHFDVPELFLVDSLKAIEDQEARRRPTGEFGRLLDVLTTQLAASERIRVRRANVLDLVQATLERSRSRLAAAWPDVETLETALDEERHKLVGQMSQRLGEQLNGSRSLWERRLVGAVTQAWGFSPFSAVLRLYNGLGSLIASMSLFRARNSAQMALIGALQGARWFRAQQQQRESESQLERLAGFGIEDDDLRESHLVIGGYARSAKLDAALPDSDTMSLLRDEAVRVEESFLGDAGRRIDEMINELSKKNSGWFVRGWYETLLLVFVGFVLYRVGRNFFYDSFVDEKAVLGMDFFVSAGLFLVLWSSLLVMAFVGRLRRGLNARITALANELAGHRVSRGLFPDLEEGCRRIASSRLTLDIIVGDVQELRNEVAGSQALGSPLPVNTVT
jgi:hypothetical protein